MEKDEKGEPVICHTSKDSVYILRILNRKEKEDIFNILKKNEEKKSGQNTESEETAAELAAPETSEQTADDIEPLTEEIDGELLEEITGDEAPTVETKVSVAYDAEGNPVTRPVSKPASTPSADEGMEDIDINMFS